MNKETAIKIINCLFEKSNKWYKDRSSYGFKHDLEYYAKDNKLNCIPYISNDDFKAIMIELGFERRSDDDNINDFYKLKPIIDYKNIYENKSRLSRYDKKLSHIECKISKFIKNNCPYPHLEAQKNEFIKKISEIRTKIYGKFLII